MQRVTNCILIHNDHILLIKKQRRGRYSITGRKMEQGETIKQSAVREFYEETNLHIKNPSLIGVFTISMYDDQEAFVRDWMMFTFVSHSYEGQLDEYCDEGELEWIPISAIDQLPMAEGGRAVFHHALNEETMLLGAFSYTEEFVLLNSQFDPSIT